MKLWILLALSIASASQAATTVDFNEFALPTSGYDNNTGGFASRGASFNNAFTDYGGGFTGWTGFSLSNVNDTTTSGFDNQYASFAGGGVGGGGNYVVAFPPSTIALPAGRTPASVRLTNTTYAALSIRDGDQFAKKFGGPSGDDADFFSVTFAGLDAAGAPTGEATFLLADYRFADNARDYIVSDWATLDLTPLGAARSIELSFASSDVGAFGINTPTYVALDDLTLVPEPATLAIALGAALLVRRRR